MSKPVLQIGRVDAPDQLWQLAMIEINALKKRVQILEGRQTGRPGKAGKAELVMAMVAEEFGITVKVLISRARPADIALARQTAAHLLHVLYGFCDSKVGELLNRDHTSICDARRAVKERMETEPAFGEQVERLKARILAALQPGVNEVEEVMLAGKGTQPS